MDSLRRSFVVAAGGLALVVILSQLSYTTAQPHFSDWSAPVNLGAVINTAFDESGAALSKDRRSLYFSSNRPGVNTVGLDDIFVSHRESEEEPWGLPTNLGPLVNSTADDITPNLSRDGHWLFLMSRRTVSFGGFDIWVSYREHTHDDFAWQAPVNVGPGVNGPSFDQTPFFFENEEAGLAQLYFTRTTPTGNDIFLSNRLTDGTFGPATLVPELNSTAADAAASVRFDGLEVFLQSRRPGGVGASDLWTATRNSVLDPWSTPTHLGGVVNSIDLDFNPHIATDGETLYFTSTRSGGFGTQDLYVTTRAKQKP